MTTESVGLGDIVAVTVQFPENQTDVKVFQLPVKKYPTKAAWPFHDLAWRLAKADANAELDTGAKR